jgi:hypothetical protein
MVNRKIHYCKHCDSNFKVKIHELETGDFFLVCPNCKWKHYRFFKNGVAIHCELKERLGEPIVIEGTNE